MAFGFISQNQLDRIEGYLHQINHKLDHIMAKQTETAAELASIKDQLSKARAEIVGKIDALIAELAEAGVESSPAVTQLVSEIREIAQVLDDLNPDAEAPPA